jgi:SAM-dependent methyltransferase
MAINTWGEEIAARYDDSSPEMFDQAVVGPAVDFLAALAGDGRALEFAIGTGRIGLPLSARGVDVAGIELSQPMVDRMLDKPGADQVPVTIGDMATTTVDADRGDGAFSLVYLVFNTITNLLTQDEQVACFQNAARHLDIGGHFVIEVFVPGLRRLQPGETFVPFDVSDRHLGFDEYDPVDQRLVSHHYWVEDGRSGKWESAHRYGWPAEYDLMARLAGMTLVQRWGDWDRRPFTSDSTSHISVWQKRAPAG